LKKVEFVMILRVILVFQIYLFCNLTHNLSELYYPQQVNKKLRFLLLMVWWFVAACWFS